MVQAGVGVVGERIAETVALLFEEVDFDAPGPEYDFVVLGPTTTDGLPANLQCLGRYTDDSVFQRIADLIAHFQQQSGYLHVPDYLDGQGARRAAISAKPQLPLF